MLRFRKINSTISSAALAAAFFMSKTGVDFCHFVG